MFTKLLAYEIRSRYRADARSFGAFIAAVSYTHLTLPTKA